MYIVVFSSILGNLIPTMWIYSCNSPMRFLCQGTGSVAISQDRFAFLEVDSTRLVNPQISETQLTSVYDQMGDP